MSVGSDGGGAMIRAVPDDVAQIDAFLARHAEASMFPLGNLRRFGLDGIHRNACTYWICRDAAGAITDVLAQSNAGFVLPQCPSGDWSAIAATLRGRRVAGVIGPRGQVRPILAATGLHGAAKVSDNDEPFMTLSLAALTVPEGPGRIVPLAEAPQVLLLDWRTDYLVSALGVAPDAAGPRAADDIADYAAARTHVVLMDGEVPLSMSGFNARIDGTVQIGGVYTPPSLRGRGHARRALALHLAQARAEGTERAVLFASGPAAVSAYAALGFRHTGDWTLCELAVPQAVA